MRFTRRLSTGAAALSVSVLLTATVLSASPPAWADDTEIYFSQSTNNQFISPNLVFILDTSESMNQEVAGTGKSRLDTMKEALNTVINNLNNVNVGLSRFSNPGGPILFPAADLEAAAEDIEGTIAAGTTDVQVVDDTDDAEESSSGSVDISDIDLDFEPGTDFVGVRFQNVTVPQGVTIDNAYIRFTAEGTDTSPAEFNVYIEDSDDAVAFSSNTNDISSRTRIQATNSWMPQSWFLDEVYDTPDLSELLNKIIKDRPGWCGGNSLAFAFEPVSGERDAWSVEGNSGKAATLHIDWNESSVPAGGGCLAQQQSVQAQVSASSDDAEERTNGNVILSDTDLDLVKDSGNQTVGIRFQDLAIPQGAAITSAEIEFEIDQQNTQSANLVVEAHDTDDAPTFSNTDDDITDRTATTASVNWSNVAAPAVDEKLVTDDLSTIVQEIVDRTGWASGNAMAFIITGGGGPGTRIVESFDGEADAAPVLRVTYQGSGGVIKTVRQRLTEIVDQMQWKAGSPIVDTLHEVALYYRNEGVDYGTTRGVAPRQQFTRVSHPAAYTGGTLQQPAGCDNKDLNAAACAAESIDPTPVYDTPISQECQANYVVLLSDGEATDNNSQAKIEALTGQLCEDLDEGRCGTELLTFLREEDQHNTLDSDQTIRTYTIGFDSAGDSTYLQNLASAGGGEFFSASNAPGLVDAIQNVVSAVLEAPTSFAAPSLSVNAFNRLFNLDAVFFALFEPSDTKAWLGNLKKFQICSDPDAQNCTLGEILDANGDPAIDSNNKIKSSAESFWGQGPDGPDVMEGGAGAHIPAHADRTVLTYTGTDDAPTGGILLDAGHEVNNTNVSKTMLGNATMGDALPDDIIGWLRGQDVKDENGNLDTNDNRWAFADPLHSRPVTVTFGAEDDGSGNPDPTKPIIKLLVGGNDGSLRMINEATGEEEWIFYPPELLPQAEELMNDALGDHLYGLDGTPTVRIVDDNGDAVIDPTDGDGIIDPSLNEKVQVFVGMRRGGANLYGLDITPDSVLTDAQAVGQVTPTFMWRILGGTGDFDHLGQTWSTPTVTKIRKGTGGGPNNSDSEARGVLVFGGGNDVPAQDDNFIKTDTAVPSSGNGTGNAIYIVDADDGSRIFWASNTNSGADLELEDMDYPIPADIALLDSDRDGETDRMYAVDTGGQVWRLDLDPTLRENDPGNTAGGLLATISIPAASPDFLPDDERRMFARIDVAEVRDEFFSSVPQYDAVVVGTGFRAHPNNTDVQDRIYIFRDFLFDESIATNGSNFPLCNNVAADPGNPVVPCPALTEANLVNLTDNQVQAGNQSATDSLLDGNGWYIVLQEEDDSFVGEKVLAKATILDGIIFLTTFKPADTSADPCAAEEGSGQLFALDLFTGGSIIDFSGNGSLEKADRVLQIGQGIPSEVVPVFQEDGVTLLIGSGGGAAAVDPGVGLPRDRTFWFQE